MLRLNNITLEGPDLSGKTSVFNSIHEATNFKYNIQDRSELSMLCYAELYGRDTKIWHKRLRDRLNKLNDRMIVILPTIDAIFERYRWRGDEVQDEVSLKKLHSIFTKHIKKYSAYSTLGVILGDQGGIGDVTKLCCSWLKSKETKNLNSIADDIIENASASNDEAYPITFQLDMRSYLERNDLADIMLDENENEYYESILKNVIKNIDMEVSGSNEYNIEQNPLSTRRFIHTEPTCISLFHTMNRQNRLDFYAVCRSSDTVKTFPSDLRFLVYLSQYVIRYLDLDLKPEINLNVTMHSAHIIEKLSG